MRARCAYGSVAVWTNKPEYWSWETATIYGSGFNPNVFYDIPVIRPDGSLVRGDGSQTPGWDTIQANAYGNFLCYYKLDGIAGLYEVRVYNSPWSGSLYQTPLATTTFTDKKPSANLDQIRNGEATLPEDPGAWVNGNLNEQQAHYIEGYSVSYRCVMEDLPTGTSITLTLGYDIKHSGKHALDYLTHYNRLNNPSHSLVFGHPPETINSLAGVSGVSGTMTTFTIPAPGSTGSPVPGQPTTSYSNLVAAEGPSSVKMTLYGGTITGIAYAFEGDLTASQAETQIDVTFAVDSSTAVLAWGGHIAGRLDWGYDVGGDPRSAGGISGSPYHMRLVHWTLDELGGQDRSLSAGAAYAAPGTIIVRKITTSGVDTFWFDGAGTEMPTGFDYFSITTITPGVLASRTFSNVKPGTYTVAEQALAGWDLTGITINDPDGGSSYTGSTATLDVDSGETVTVAFTNTRVQCPVTFYTDPSSVGSIGFQSATHTDGQSHTYAYGSSGLVTANVPSGYTFGHWEVTDNVGVDSTTDNPTTFTVTCGGTLKAVFAQIICPVTFYTDPSTGGGISFESKIYTNGQSDAFAYGTSGLATGNAPTGYGFDHWEVTGNVQITSTTTNPATITVTCGGDLKAVFKQVQVMYTVTFYTDPLSTGSITFAATTYTHGQSGQHTAGSYSVTANAPSGWSFDHWSTSGGVSISSPTATVTGDGSITAFFTQVTVKYTVIFYTDPSNVGSITFDGTTYTNGQSGQYTAGSYSVTANAPSGWTSDHWVTTGGVSISSPASVTGDGSITAVFKCIVCKAPVGGEWVSINKSAILAPWLTSLASLIAVTTSFVYVKRRKKQQN